MKIKGILKILIIFMIVFFLNSSVVFADDSSYNSVQQFESYTESTDTINSTGDNIISTLAGIILTILRIVALGVAIIMLMFIGIKYMTTVDPHMKGEVKKRIPTYVLAAIILFAAAGILQLVTVFVNDILEI